MHLPHLITDLALILIVAVLAALICRWLRQPVVLGYLFAGILVGPQVPIVPTVLEQETVKVWAELGVIFFLFHLGIEFSFKKLLQVGRPAFIAATFEVLGMIGLGYLVGKVLGWASMDALFLGAILSISSTTIIIKAFDELSIKTQRFASMVFGILVIEDLFAILILVFLSTIAASRSFEGIPLLIQISKLGGFLLVVVPIGILLFPRLLRYLRPYFNDETRVIFSLAACLGLVVLSAKSGLSPALGAFLMGAFIAETVESDKMDRFLSPIKHFFGAVFFTSIGMLVNVREIFDHLGLVVVITFLTIIGKTATTTAGMLLARQDKTLSLQTGLSLAQIGEFSFIIATLGLTLNVIRPDLYPLAVAVSLLTTFTTPYLIRLATSPLLAKLKKNQERKQERPKGIGRKFWEGHLVELEIHPHFTQIGSSLEQLGLREKFGITVVSIIRGERRLIAPTKMDRLMAFDRVIVLGTESQLRTFETFLRSDRHEVRDLDEAVYELRQVTLAEPSPFIGKNLRESEIRLAIDGLVLGIERNLERIFNPLSTEILREGDILWLYGRREKIRDLNQVNS